MPAHIQRKENNMNIYSFPSVNLTKILLTAQELNVHYELHIMHAIEGEHKSKKHLTRHPLGMVPTVEIDGEFYYESNTICRLLAERNKNKLYAHTPEKKARINQWMDLMAHHIGRNMQVFFFEERIKVDIFGGKTNWSLVEEAGKELSQQLPIMEAALDNNVFLTGEDITLADIVAFSYCHIHEYTDLDLTDYPGILSWYKTIKSRPAFKRAVAHTVNGNLFHFEPN